MSERLPRRTLLKRIGAVFLGTGTALGIGYVETRPAVALEAEDELLADDVRIDRNDGELTAVTAAPELRLQWSDFGGGLETVEVTLSASLDGVGGFDVLLDTTVEDEAVTVAGDGFGRTDGTATITIERQDLTAVGSAVTTDDFGGDLAPGESRTTAVELALRVDIVGTQEETVTALETASFGVTVHNPEGTATTTGRANTGAE
jgi:hypothetical protein